jgi:putative DNA primase/helicase
MATVETNCCFFATGNNLTIAGDLSARALVCRIDPEVERPEEREFAVDLHSWVPAHRGELVAAALTIIRAHLVAGAPKPAVPNFARFEEWQRLCRYPLIWLGCADPCDSRELIEQADPVRESLRALLAAWHKQFGNGQTTVNEAIKAATEGTDLQCAMDAIAGEKGGINARRLGRFISRHERRIEGGLRFEKGNKHGGATRWLARSDQFVKFDQFPPGRSRENGFSREEIWGVGGKKPFYQTGWGQTAETEQTDPCATVSEVDL